MQQGARARVITRKLPEGLRAEDARLALQTAWVVTESLGLG